MRVVVVGAGGHARSVIDALRTSLTELDPIGCTDPDPARAGSTVDGVPVLGADHLLRALRAEGVEGACLGIGGVGDNQPRAELHARLRSIGFVLPTVVHGRAYVARSARLGEATVVLAGAVVGAGCVLGEDVIVNSGAIVDHDCRVGDHVHLASGCTLGGGVTVDAHAHVGLGAKVLQRRHVGTNALVGAGAVVVHDVGPDQVAVGCPARAKSR